MEMQLIEGTDSYYFARRVKTRTGVFEMAFGKASRPQILLSVNYQIKQKNDCIHVRLNIGKVSRELVFIGVPFSII